MRGLAITARATAAAVRVTLVGGVADAPAVTVTIGPPTLTTTASSFGCFGISPCDNMGSQATHPDSSVRVAAPGDGVITVWRAVGGQSGTGALRFRVLRPVGGGKLSGVGTSGAPVDLSGGSNPTNLPVQVGDRIAFEATDDNPFAENTFVRLDMSAGTFDEWFSGFADGAPPQAPAGSATGILQLNADEQLAAPVVSAISPTGGPTAGGTTVTITGDHLANASAVTFGGAAGSIVSNTNTEVVATAPPGAAGAVDVGVTTIGGTSATSSADRFTYVAPVPPPRIATVSSLSESHAVFTVGHAATPLTGLTAAARRHPPGTTFSFVLDQAAQVTVTIG